MVYLANGFIKRLNLAKNPAFLLHQKLVDPSPIQVAILDGGKRLQLRQGHAERFCLLDEQKNFNIRICIDAISAQPSGRRDQPLFFIKADCLYRQACFFSDFTDVHSQGKYTASGGRPG